MYMETIAPGRALDLNLEALELIEAPDRNDNADFLFGVAVGIIIGGLIVAT